MGPFVCCPLIHTQVMGPLLSHLNSVASELLVIATTLVHYCVILYLDRKVDPFIHVTSYLMTQHQDRPMLAVVAMPSPPWSGVTGQGIKN